MDLGTVASLLGNVKTATEIARAIKDSGVTLEQAEIKIKLADLLFALAEVKTEAADVRQALLDAQERIRELEEEAKLKAELQWHQPYYWRTGKDGEAELFCQPCRDTDKRLSRLHTDGKGLFQCRVCRQGFKSNEREVQEKVEADAAIRDRPNPWGR